MVSWCAVLSGVLLRGAALCWLCQVVLLCPPPPLLLPLLSGCALRPVVLCRVLLCALCCAALCWCTWIVLFGAGLVYAVAGASVCGVLLCVVVFPLAFCGAVVLPCCVVGCVVVPCCRVLRPVVLCYCLVLCCRALLCFFLCCLRLFLLLPEKQRIKMFFAVRPSSVVLCCAVLLRPGKLHPGLHLKGGICDQKNEAHFPRVCTRKLGIGKWRNLKNPF